MEEKKSIAAEFKSYAVVYVYDEETIVYPYATEEEAKERLEDCYASNMKDYMEIGILASGFIDKNHTRAAIYLDEGGESFEIRVASIYS